MARFFVCSDIHEAESRLEMYLANQSGIDTVIVCGDLEMEVYDVEEIIRRYTSRSRVPDQITVTLTPKHRALVTHGHLYRANRELMAYAAKENHCDIVIYGHTHIPLDKEEYGIRFLNPGSVRDGSYMIIETDGNGDMEVTLN